MLFPLLIKSLQSLGILLFYRDNKQKCNNTTK
jgi:hypothetical protein